MSYKGYYIHHKGMGLKIAFVFDEGEYGRELRFQALGDYGFVAFGPIDYVDGPKEGHHPNFFVYSNFFTKEYGQEICDGLNMGRYLLKNWKSEEVSEPIKGWSLLEGVGGTQPLGSN